MADDTFAAVTVNLLAFVQSEKLVSSPDAGWDFWVPHPGPYREPDQVIRHAVFAWDMFDQEWRREMDFQEREAATRYAAGVHARLMARWQVE